MQAYTTPVLTDRVPYDWQQLKQAARASVPEEQPASNTLSEAFEKELVDALIPLILERIHAQVSIMVDMTMKRAASKIKTFHHQINILPLRSRKSLLLLYINPGEV